MSVDYESLREQRLAKVTAEYRDAIAQWPSLPEIGVDGLRAMMANHIPGGVVEGVGVRDVDIPGPHGSVPTRIYTPQDISGPVGVAIHFHFGGFVAGGGLAFLDAINSRLAAEVPCVVVAPDFRLPPEHRFPIGVEDCWAVTNWVAEHGAENGWDATRIAVGGGCTGGNFAAVIALMARDAGAPRIALQFLQSWPADARCDTRSQHEFADGYGLRYTDNQFVISQYINKDAERYDWRVSPLLARSVRGVAPALITVGEWDILRDEDVQYADRLTDAGVPVELHVAPEEGHVGNPANAGRVETVLHSALRRSIGPDAVTRE